VALAQLLELMFITIQPKGLKLLAKLILLLLYIKEQALIGGKLKTGADADFKR
jgi:hypothetical protein